MKKEGRKVGLINNDSNLFSKEKEIFNKLAKELFNRITKLTAKTNFIYYYKILYIIRKV